MNDRSGRGRRSVPEALDRGLVAYAVAAAAGLAAAPELAEGSIVYTDASDVTIEFNGESIDLDLDNNGTVDAKLYIEAYDIDEGFNIAGSSLLIAGNGAPTSVVGSPDVLSAGTTIGPLSTLDSIQSGRRLMANAYATTYFEYSEGNYYYGGFASTGGAWAEATDGFLGLQFFIDGTAHFGWARLDVFADAYYEGYQSSATIRATLKDFAFENCPGEAIVAGATEGGATCASSEVPAPSALGLLALGAAGLAVWRRRQG